MILRTFKNHLSTFQVISLLCFYISFRWLEKVDSSPGLTSGMIEALRKKRQQEPEIYARFLRVFTMHFSAKHGIGIACHLSVCLSICNVGGSGPHGLEVLKTNFATNSLTPSLFVARRSSVGWEKMACWCTKVAISLKCIKMEQKLLCRTCMNSPTLF